MADMDVITANGGMNNGGSIQQDELMNGDHPAIEQTNANNANGQIDMNENLNLKNLQMTAESEQPEMKQELPGDEPGNVESEADDVPSLEPNIPKSSSYEDAFEEDVAVVTDTYIDDPNAHAPAEKDNQLADTSSNKATESTSEAIHTTLDEAVAQETPVPEVTPDTKAEELKESTKELKPEEITNKEEVPANEGKPKLSVDVAKRQLSSGSNGQKSPTPQSPRHKSASGIPRLSARPKSGSQEGPPSPKEGPPAKVNSPRSSPKKMPSAQTTKMKAPNSAGKSPRKIDSPRREPPSKAKVGECPKPNMKAKSKVGSTANIKHVPGGGNVKITDEKKDFKQVQSKCGSKANIKHKPGGGNVKVETKKLDFSSAQSKCGSLDNARHKPSGGKVQIENRKLDFSKTTSKVGSKDNIKHKPGGGDVQIVDEQINFKAEAKIGSKVNLKHQPGGGDIQITNEHLQFKQKAAPKVGSKANIKHKPGGGDVEILDEHLSFKDAAAPKVGSKSNIKYQPGGGDIKILDEKLTFKENASPRTDHGMVADEEVAE